jgi:hypothetical protein
VDPACAEDGGEEQTIDKLTTIIQDCLIRPPREQTSRVHSRASRSVRPDPTEEEVVVCSPHFLRTRMEEEIAHSFRTRPDQSKVAKRS